MLFKGLDEATRFLVWALAALYVAAAVAGPVFFSFGTGQSVAWVSLLAGGTVVMLAGQHLVEPPKLSAALVSVGAIVGGFPLVLTIIVPLAVAVVIASSIALARRESTPA